MVASEEGHSITVKVLLEAGADENGKCKVRVWEASWAVTQRDESSRESKEVHLHLTLAIQHVRLRGASGYFSALREGATWGVINA